MTEKNINILITADSICDLPKEILRGLPVEEIPFYVVTEEGRFVDKAEIDAEGMINYLAGGGESRRAYSEPPSEEEYRRFFLEKRMNVHQILHISMGKKSSESYARALEASQNVSKVTVVDSGLISSGYGIVVLKAAQLAAEGKSLDQILEGLQKISARVVSEFIVKDIHYLARNDRFNRKYQRICERLALHPVFKMRDSRLVTKRLTTGQWRDLTDKYIEKTFSASWRIDREILFITYAGESEEELEHIRSEIEKYVHFEHIYVQQVTPAILVNSGPGVLGFGFMKKKKSGRKGEIPEESIGWFRGLRSGLGDILLRDDYSIRHKLMNIIIVMAILGGLAAMAVTARIGMWTSTFLALALIMVAVLSLNFSIHNKPILAGHLLCFVANVCFFPALYFFSGGMYSAMPLWFALGLIFDWLILEGWYAVVMYLVNYAILAGVVWWAEKYPELVRPTPEGYMMSDILQGLLIISLVMGMIIRFQNRAYENQKKKLEQREKEIVAASGAKDIFLANMSHEIRTPINGIIGMDTMLLRECGDNEQLRMYGKNIQSASQTLLSLVNDILDISKIEAGKLEILPIEYELFSVINDCCVMTKARIGDRKLEFHVKVNPMIPQRLYGDEVRLRQVINNLLSNAVKYTKEGRVLLNVDMEPRGDAIVVLVVSVADTGIGIRPEDRKKLFLSFSRVDQIKNRNIEGTGLGLNLTKNLVDMMDGEITVDSIYGQGSTFTVRIPQGIRNRTPMGDFQIKVREKMRETDIVAERFRAPDANVLVVDDVPLNLAVAEGLMKEIELSVDQAESGPAALRMTEEKAYDIIFMDHLMPEMDGVECFKELKKMKNNPNLNTPVIILTANAILGAREKYIEIGFSDYMAKPMEEQELYRLLRKYLPIEKIRPANSPHKKETHLQFSGKEIAEKEEKPESEPIEEKPEETDSGNVQDRPEKPEDVPIEKKAEEPASGSGNVLDRLNRLEGVDTRIGIGYCMNDPKMYEDVVMMYIDGEKSLQLEEDLAKENFEDYQITVHGVKSSSLNIGAKTLSEKAKELEMACKAGDHGKVQQLHPDFMRQYRDLLERLREIF